MWEGGSWLDRRTGSASDVYDGDGSVDVWTGSASAANDSKKMQMVSVCGVLQLYFRKSTARGKGASGICRRPPEGEDAPEFGLWLP